MNNGNESNRLKVTKIEKYEGIIDNLNKEAILNGLAVGLEAAASIFALCNASNMTGITTKQEFVSSLIYLIGGFSLMGVSGIRLKKLIENIASKIMYQNKIDNLKEEYINDSDSYDEDERYDDESEIDIETNSDSTINIKHVHTLNIK